ncbi:unnamed protein product, partial [Nesidiocoris tenuis]
MDLVAQSFNHRLTTGYTRNDFIQLLLQLREKGSVEFEDLDEEDEREKNSLTHHEQDKNVIETLRLFPPLVINFRVCNKDYTFPDGTTIEKGTKIVLPTYAIHHDPSNFPNPEEFRPERFEQSIAKGSYAPFGDGPRVCIDRFCDCSSNRLGSMQ